MSTPCVRADWTAPRRAPTSGARRGPSRLRSNAPRASRRTAASPAVSPAPSPSADRSFSAVRLSSSGSAAAARVRGDCPDVLLGGGIPHGQEGVGGERPEPGVRIEQEAGGHERISAAQLEHAEPDDGLLLDRRAGRLHGRRAGRLGRWGRARQGGEGHGSSSTASPRSMAPSAPSARRRGSPAAPSGSRCGFFGVGTALELFFSAGAAGGGPGSPAAPPPAAGDSRAMGCEGATTAVPCLAAARSSSLK
jgi:hypothetical protein